MKELNRRAFSGLLRFLICLASFVFLPAWTLHYWQAWMFLAVFSVSTLALTLYLMKTDPKLLERRVNAGPAAEKEHTQRIIQSVMTVAFVAVIVFPAIDHRLAWSSVPSYAVIAGDVAVMLGFLIIFFVFRVNTFTSGIVEVDAQQKVISTGPYGLVRHPMYVGALVMFLGVPVSLGSWWGLFIVIPFTLGLIWRLLNEEEFLVKHLAGYAEYREKVRYRLVPNLW